MRDMSWRAGLTGALLFLASLSVHAVSPLVAPGDYRFRHDIQLLRDAGLVSGPVAMWPVSLPQLHADLADVDTEEADLSSAVSSALRRVTHRLDRAREGGASARASIRVGNETPFIRSFEDAPRGEVEVGAGASWTGDRFAGELRVAGVEDDPRDDETLRLDGSWLGVRLGNWMLSAGKMQRSWGPAWQGGLIISNNARPRPGVTLRRMRTDAFETPWLSWVGPWNFTTFVERLESDRAVSNALLWGMRLSFSPFQSLQLGISRSAVFGGEGNNVDFGTVANLVTGQTTSTSQVASQEDSIDQLGGFDARWNIPYVNAAIYGEMIGEDESGSRPNLFMGQGGVEFWGGLGDGGGSWRLVVERADTKADVLDTSEREGDEELGIAYNNAAFDTGYRYRNRVIGHPAEADALLTSVRLLLNFSEGSFLNVAYLDGDLNRAVGVDANAAADNTLTNRNEDVKQLSMSWKKQFHFGRVELGIGETEREPVGSAASSTDNYAWIGFDRRF